MKHLPRHRLSQPVWHQTRPSNALLQFEDPATYEGRYHRAGGSGAWYASLTERGAWAELFRHWSQHEISPFEVRRRVGRAATRPRRAFPAPAARAARAWSSATRSCWTNEAR